LSEKGNIELRPVVHAERTLGITVPDLEIKPNSHFRIKRRCTKDFQDKLAVSLKLCSPMAINKTDASTPGTEYSSPVRFGLEDFASTGAVFLDECEASSKLPRFVIVVVPSVHGGMKLLKIHKMILGNRLPN
jgi:hypothetical protein